MYGFIDFMLKGKSLLEQWCNLTLAQRFWTTKVCLWESKISKTCLFGHLTVQATSWEAAFENCSRYYLIKCKSFSVQLLPLESPWAGFLTVWSSIDHFLVHSKMWLRIPCTCSPPTTHIHSSSSQIHILEFIRNSVVGTFCGRSLHVKVIGCFHREAASLMFGGVLNMTLSKEVSATGFTQRNLKLFLPLNSPDLH